LYREGQRHTKNSFFLLRAAPIAAKILRMMRKKLFQQRPLLTIPQIIILLGVVGILFVGLDLTRRAQAGREVGVGEESLLEEISIESTRHVELQATLEYVQSDDYVEAYARGEGGYIKPGEKRIVPMPVEVPPDSSSLATPTPDPAAAARPWQAWWRLLSDSPQPSR
jgi:cell division protein FtsB